jgi:hypothetical protein
MIIDRENQFKYMFRLTHLTTSYLSPKLNIHRTADNPFFYMAVKLGLSPYEEKNIDGECSRIEC